MSIGGGYRGSRTQRFVTFLTALALLTVLTGPSSAYPRPGKNERVSVASDGSQGATARPTGNFYRSALSSSGRYVVFSSPLSGLDPRDTNVETDIFRHDRVTGKTELVVVNSHGLQAIRPTDSLASTTHHATINGSGRYIAFNSDALDLEPPGGILATDIRDEVYVIDMSTKQVERVSVTPDGDIPDGESWNPAISGSGRFVAFQSSATDLVETDVGGQHHVYLRDRHTDETEIVDVSSSGELANTGVEDSTVSISRNGRWVVFQTAASNLANNDTNGSQDVFVRDRKTQKTFLVSVGSNDVHGSGAGLCNVGRQAISNDGRYVVFCSGASEFVPNDTNRAGDIFVHDRKSRRTERVSVDSSGQEATGSTFLTSISGNGRVVAIGGDANNLAPGDTGGGFCAFSPPPVPQPCLPEGLLGGDTDVFVHEMRSGATYLASVGRDGAQAEGCVSGGTAFFPTLDEAGDTISFASCATNLVSGDSNAAPDQFVREIGPLLGMGGSGPGSGNGPGDDEPCAAEVCVPRVCVPPICIPPMGSISAPDEVGDNGSEEGTDLIEAGIAYRPNLDDLFVSIELEHMPTVRPGISPTFYGLRYELADKHYEVRATSLLGGTFGLFDCTISAPACIQVAELQGGYGTTGMRIVFSLPLAKIGLDKGGELEDVEAFSGIGTFQTGAMKVLDTVRIE